MRCYPLVSDVESDVWQHVEGVMFLFCSWQMSDVEASQWIYALVAKDAQPIWNTFPVAYVKNLNQK